MTNDPADAQPSRLREQWQHRRRRSVVSTAAALVIVGAFLLWGPIGLGRGPLSVPSMAVSFGSVQATTQPTAYIATLVNSGGSTAVIDRVTVTSARGYSPDASSACASPATACMAASATARQAPTSPPVLGRHLWRRRLRCRTAREHRDRKPQRPWSGHRDGPAVSSPVRRCHCDRAALSRRHTPLHGHRAAGRSVGVRQAGSPTAGFLNAPRRI